MTYFLIGFVFINDKNSERLAMMTVTFTSDIFFYSLPSEKKIVSSRKRHVTKLILLQKN